MILIAYDGSPDADAAIDRAGLLLKGQSATVLSVWEPFEDVVTRAGAGMTIGAIDWVAIDRSYQDQAGKRAEDGAERAQAAGLTAEPRIQVRRGTIADTILEAADDVDADAIVLGTRGLTRLKSLLLGSVSHAVLQNAGRPVMVVPSAEVAEARTARRG